ncbi:Alcohol dehydrogenase 4 [Porphyridium purpureum]|uniref:Alcohol dehydrogenase 4 n=1 Tax=Porphyridium purpureum TaxID=35688 RepID=A0A5J4ZAA2_PORPP|nr:Alcohol dehydrogenase 4 [Porphyridium purpureum]|eukprot:POR9155..scf295_1
MAQDMGETASNGAQEGAVNSGAMTGAESERAYCRVASIQPSGNQDDSDVLPSLLRVCTHVLLDRSEILRIAILRKRNVRPRGSQRKFALWQEAKVLVMYIADPTRADADTITLRHILGAQDEASLVVLHPQNRRKMASTLSLPAMSAHEPLSASASDIESSKGAARDMLESTLQVRKLGIYSEEKESSEDVVVLFASSQPDSERDFRPLVQEARVHVRALEKARSILWGSVLVDETSKSVTVVCAYASVDCEEGVGFDTTLADELVSDDGWLVDSFWSTFPDREGWGAPYVIGGVQNEQEHKREQQQQNTDVDYASVSSNVDDGDRAQTRWQTRQDEKPPSRDPTGPLASKIRLVMGFGALESITKRLLAINGGRADPSKPVRVFVITGWNAARADPLFWELKKSVERGSVQLRAGRGISAGWFGLHDTGLGEIQRLAEEARAWGADCVIGYGGGTVLDAAKIVGVLAGKGASERDIENFGHNVRTFLLERRRTLAPVIIPRYIQTLPVFLFPTVFGSGAEVEETTVLSIPGASERIRLTMVHEDDREEARRLDRLGPRMTLLFDPRLGGARLLPGFAALGGLNAACMCIESMLSRSRTSMSFAIAADGLARMASSFDAVINRHDDAAAVAQLQQATVFGGLARETCGSGIACNLALQLGVRYRFQVAFPRFLPAVLEVALEEASADPRLGHIETIQHCARLVTQNDKAISRDLIEWLYQKMGILQLADLDVPSLRHADEVRDFCSTILAGGALNAESTPLRRLTLDQLERIVRMSVIVPSDADVTTTPEGGAAQHSNTTSDSSTPAPSAPVQPRSSAP